MSASTNKRSPPSSQLMANKIARLEGENKDREDDIGAEEKPPVYKSPVVLGEVPIHLHKDYEGFSMFSESDQFAAESGQATQSILDSVCKSLMDEPPDPPPGVNVEAVLKAVDYYNDATFQEPEGTNPERRPIINTGISLTLKQEMLRMRRVK